MTPLDNSKDNWYDKGSSTTDRCPREGSMLLEGRDGTRTIVNTNCNTWRCVSCRDRNAQRFRALVKHGVSRLGRCMFITITYKRGSQRLESAGCVARDWRAFWRLLNRQWPETKEWGVLRVMEVTKKQTPHFHLIVGQVSSYERCYGRSFRIATFLERFETCECWSHRCSRAWSMVTAGESYIVHSMPVVGASGAAGYLAKYMNKEFEAERAVQLGMIRRYSTNRKWPREKRRRLVSPGTDGWRRTAYAHYQVDTDRMPALAAYPKTGTEEQKKEAVTAAAERYTRARRKNADKAGS